MKAHATYVLWAIDRWAVAADGHASGREQIEKIFGGAGVVANNPWRMDEDKYGCALACLRTAPLPCRLVALCCGVDATIKGVYPELP